jgi:hypothetical protein
MKYRVRNFVVLSVFAMALTGLSLAQTNSYRLAANIPFDFYAGDQQLPAGAYLFNVGYEAHVVSLRNQDTGRTYMVLAVPADGEASGEVVVEFEVIGDSHALASLKTASTGVAFAESKRVRMSAQSRGSVAITAAVR